MNEQQVRALARALYAVIYQPMERSSRTFDDLGAQQRHQLEGKAALILAELAQLVDDTGNLRNGHGVRRTHS